MAARRDLTGQQFGRLTATSFAHTNHRHEAVWRCVCSCGNTTQVTASRLRTGNTKSCGCLRRDHPSQLRHGDSTSKEYSSWNALQVRCRNPNNRSFHNYGGRGITVDPRWLQYENFLADMGRAPSPKHSIDRIDNDKGYGPENCKWSTAAEQANNRRTNRWLDTPRGEMTVTEAAETYGLKWSTLNTRLRSGWDLERALTTPTAAACIKTPEGEMTLGEAARSYGINAGTLNSRLTKGWAVERALTTPVRRKAA